MNLPLDAQTTKGARCRQISANVKELWSPYR